MTGYSQWAAKRRPDTMRKRKMKAAAGVAFASASSVGAQVAEQRLGDRATDFIKRRVAAQALNTRGGRMSPDMAKATKIFRLWKQGATPGERAAAGHQLGRLAKRAGLKAADIERASGPAVPFARMLQSSVNHGRRLNRVVDKGMLRIKRVGTALTVAGVGYAGYQAYKASKLKRQQQAGQ